jgi:hypothetical protein
MNALKVAASCFPLLSDAWIGIDADKHPSKDKF